MGSRLILGLVLGLWVPSELSAGFLDLRSGYLQMAEVQQIQVGAGGVFGYSWQETGLYTGFGFDAARINLFLDSELNQDYGPNWSGLLGIPFLLHFYYISQSFKNNGQETPWFRVLLFPVQALSFLVFPQGIFHFRGVIGPGNGHLRLAGGMDTDIYLWSEKALVLKPWIGGILQTSHHRGVFHKMMPVDSGVFVEGRFIWNLCWGTGPLPYKVHNRPGWQVQAGWSF